MGITRLHRQPVLVGAIIATLTAVMAAVIILGVPVNVDESVQYHVIACNDYPNARYHTFWNPCDGSMDLQLLGVRIPRSYNYIGGLSSVLYWPFYKVYPSIATQRTIGLFFLAAYLFVIGRLEPEHPPTVLILFGVSFPILYQVIADTGPIRYSLFLITLTPLWMKLIERAKTRRRHAIFSVVLGILLFLAVEDKPFFLYFTPSIAALALAYNDDPTTTILENARRLLVRSWITVATFLGLTSLYLFGSHTAWGRPYLAELATSVKPADIASVSLTMVSYMTNFAKFSSMVYETRQFRLLNVCLTLAISLWSFVFIAKALRLDPPLRRKMLLTLIAVACGIAVMLIARNAWTGHHFIYCLVMGMFVVCQAVSRVERNRKAFLAAYCLVTVVMIAEIPHLDPGKTWSWERYRVFDYLKQPDVASQHVIAHLSKGTYYVSSLYGDRSQLAVQVGEVDADTATRLISLSNQLHRRLLCVCHGAGCDAETLKRKFQSRITFAEVPLSTREWHVYVETPRRAEELVASDVGFRRHLTQPHRTGGADRRLR